MISTETQRNDYTGNGSTADYDYDFKIFNREDLLVVVNIDGVETVLVLDTDYSVDGAGEEIGGSISLLDLNQDWLDGSGFLDVGVLLTITRDMDYVQDTDIKNQGDFFPEVHENTFDKIVMQIQQLKDLLSRTLLSRITELPNNFELPSLADRINKYFKWDANGDPTAVNVEEDINHNNLTGYVANEHINHASVTLTAGEGLSGGGDITQSRQFDVDIAGSTSEALATSDLLLFADVSNSNAIRKATVLSLLSLLSPAMIPHDDLAGVDTSQYHKKLSNLTITRDGNDFITQLNWANGDQEVFNRDGNDLITSIVGNVWTKTFTRDGNDFITDITYTLT